MRRHLLIAVLVGAVACWASLVEALTLTPAQRAALKAHIQANSDTNTLYVVGDLQGLTDLLNATAAPDFWVWRTSLSEADATQATSVDGTTFTWVGNGFITRSVGEQTAWARLFSIGVNPSLASVRAAFNDILSGTGNAAANRAHLLAVSRRKATRAEKVWATGTGSTASPATLVVEGLLTYQDLVGL